MYTTSGRRGGGTVTVAERSTGRQCFVYNSTIVLLPTHGERDHAFEVHLLMVPPNSGELCDQFLV